MKTARIVLAADEPAATLNWKLQLGELGYQVVGDAPDGAGMVRLGAALKPDLIIMDINMPSLSDFQAAKTMKEASRIPVIMLSGYYDQKLVEAATQAGISGFLIKPVTKQHLAPAIAVTLQNHSNYCKALEELSQLHRICQDIHCNT